jgi:diaminopimelate epimerase
VAWLLMEEGGSVSRRIETVAGMLYAERTGEQIITIDMGSPLLGWEQIPLARAMATDRMDYHIDDLAAPGAINIGNAHVVFFVDDVSRTPIESLGPRIEHDPLFPQRVNAGFAEVRTAHQIRLRVWERGAGLTKACGTGACAAVVAAHRQGRTGRAVEVLVDGGSLQIEWRAGDDRVLMTGPVQLEGAGDLAAA